ncbi:UDP-N-acetylglucosamine 2-epimerase [Sporofaciens musculi]|uniref:UDP-N-acetylglucosamine 2-epimerase n=1 Tax=Sporofaciens musculi TaxID=2681861 RepID=UPI002570BDBA|nr:UDP-N-acetylglucosamine 2-epimerase [Sporofaciens musculi]
MKKICVVTSTRAEYGLLKPIILKLQSKKNFDVRVAVTGAHLSPEFGLTYREIVKDGIEINKKIEMLMSADTPAAISKSMGLGLIGFADYFLESRPEGVLLLGDRYEMLAVACAAMNEGIPIIHLHGGETTEGAVDDAIRHAITKMSYLHMASTETYRRRIIQMGEAPDRVFCVGAMGVENAMHTTLLKKSDLEKVLQMDLDVPYAVVTFHPVTLEKDSAKIQTGELLEALDAFPDWKFIVTKANADKDGRIINRMLDSYASNHKNIKVFDSLGMTRFLSAVKYSRMVIGNSSSGLIEAPSFHVPTINIGDRQKGRIRADSVIDCLPEKKDILRAMKRAEDTGFRKGLVNMDNPYGNGETSDKIIKILDARLLGAEVNLKKRFYDMG